MKHLLPLLRGSLGWFAGATAAGTATVAAGVGLLATGAYLIVRAGEHPGVLELTVAIVGVRFFGISRAVFRYLERLSAHDAALRLVARLRTRAFATVERLSPAGIEEERAGDLLLRLTEDLEQVEQALVRALLPVAVTALTVLGAGAAAWFLLPQAGYAVAGTMALTAAAVGAAARAAGRTRAGRLAEARGDLAAAVIDLVQGAAEAAVFGRTPDLLAAAGAADDRLTRLSRRAAWVSGAGSGLAALGSGVCLWLVARVGLEAVSTGSLDRVVLGALAMLAIAAFEPVALLPHGLLRLDEGAAAGRRLADLEGRPDPVPDPPEPGPAPAGPYLELRGASLRHRPGGPWALREVNLRLEPGRRVALVGESGAGKSTIAQALLRFRELDDGAYLVGGIDARRLSGASIRQFVGLAAEDAVLVEGTLGDNLLLGRPEAGPAELSRVLQAARLTQWVASLPQGLSTPVGRGGAEMSGGERRRISLARALLAGFPVLVADEPTAGLDPAAAAAVVAALLAVGEDRGLLLITHGAEGLEAMDEIVVLDGGRVAERGSHRRLLAQGGRYAEFWEARGRPGG
ncbi:MAG TPA: thiol reductant ABC exporter subunit CydC [Acidimicrobiia bacterium]|nr:thiol reductant ABC exporter subunit CydC [Acidimicrobiia bacterium]